MRPAPGRSFWPEPDEIRRLTGDWYKPKHNPIHPVQEKFPRAKFGLPVIFAFKREDVAAGDPKQTTLQGKKLSDGKYLDRLASPLILRPIACSDGAVGLATILKWDPVDTKERYTPPGGLWLTSEDYSDFQVESDLKPAEAGNIEPLKNLGAKPETDVLQAFLDYLK